MNNEALLEANKNLRKKLNKAEEELIQRNFMKPSEEYKVIRGTVVSAYAEASHVAKSNNQTTGDKNDYFITLGQLHEILDNACPNACHEDEDYGFVPEAGCPIHD